MGILSVVLLVAAATVVIAVCADGSCSGSGDDAPDADASARAMVDSVNALTLAHDRLLSQMPAEVQPVPSSTVGDVEQMAAAMDSMLTAHASLPAELEPAGTRLLEAANSLVNTSAEIVRAMNASDVNAATAASSAHDAALTEYNAAGAEFTRTVNNGT